MSQQQRRTSRPRSSSSSPAPAQTDSGTGVQTAIIVGQLPLAASPRRTALRNTAAHSQEVRRTSPTQVAQQEKQEVTTQTTLPTVETNSEKDAIPPAKVFQEAILPWSGEAFDRRLQPDYYAQRDIVNCVCGTSMDDTLETREMVLCDNCEQWQHVPCMQLDSEDLPDDYFCHHCLPDLHKHLWDGSSNPSTARIPMSLPDASTYRFGEPPSRPIVHHGEGSIPHATLPSRTASQVKPPTLVKIKLSASHRPSHPRSQRLTKEQARLVQADDSELDGDLEAIYEGLSQHGIPNGRHVSPSPSPGQVLEAQSTDHRVKRRRMSTAEEDANQSHQTRTKKVRLRANTPPPEEQQQLELSPATTARHRVHNVPAQIWAKQARNDDLKRSTEALNNNDIPPYIIDNRDLNQPTERALKRMTASEFRRALEIGDIAYRDMLEFAQDTLRLFGFLDSLPSGVSKGWSQLDEGRRDTAIARIAEEFEPTFIGKRYRQPAMWLLFTAYKQHLMAEQRAAKQAAAAAAANANASTQDSTQDTEMVDAVPVTRGRPKVAAMATPTASAYVSPARSTTREPDLGAAGRRSGRVKKASARAVAAAAADISGGSVSPDANRTRSVSRVRSESALDTPMDDVASTGPAKASAGHGVAQLPWMNEQTWPSAGKAQQPPLPRIPVPVMAIEVAGPTIRHPWHGMTAHTQVRQQQAPPSILKTSIESLVKVPPPNTVPIASPFAGTSTTNPPASSITAQGPMQPRPPQQVPFKATKFSPGAGLTDGSHVSGQSEPDKQHARIKHEVGTTSTHAFYGSSR